MLQDLQRYRDKIIRAGLAKASPGDIIFVAQDDEPVFWGGESFAAKETDLAMVSFLQGLLHRMPGLCLLLLRPGGVYKIAWEYFFRQAQVIKPEDSESKTFLRDLPVINHVEESAILQGFSSRSCLAIPGLGILAYGAYGPEEAFATASSAFFAVFVKFFADFLNKKHFDNLDEEYLRSMQAILDCFGDLSSLLAVPESLPTLDLGPFKAKKEIISAMTKAGQAVVNMGLVDSHFGNLSYFSDGVLRITRTGAALDELEDGIDEINIANPDCSAITASSELPAHLEVLAQGAGPRAILHGHPKFTVILSMVCPERNCRFRGSCGAHCPASRHVAGLPVIPGEVGSGPRGICRTLPPALRKSSGAVVFGHGFFALSDDDFRASLSLLWETEKLCAVECLEKIRKSF